MKTEIKYLKANHGDCILIKTFDEESKEFNILIDGGTSETFASTLKQELEKLSTINLLVLTHIDSDHIGGLNKFFKSDLFNNLQIDKFWINCPDLIKFGDDGKISYGQVKTLEENLLEKRIPLEKWNDKIIYPQAHNFKGVGFFILSPTSEILDLLHKNWPEINNNPSLEINKISSSSSVSSKNLIELANEKFSPNKNIEQDIFNSSSIAFILTTFDCSILLLGDSRTEVVIKSLIELGYNDSNNRLKVDSMKISHHGSVNNTSCELLDMIECDNFIISTNGGSSSHRHPNRETIARIVCHPKRDLKKRRRIYFNYPIQKIFEKCGQIFTNEELESYNCEIIEL